MSEESRAEVRLTLYGRSYCHLCEDMLEHLQALRTDTHFNVEVVDVDSSPDLEDRYGERVPVLVHGEHELCHYFLDAAAVTAYLASFR